MKMTYSADVDILIVELSDGRISHAEEAGGVIVHLGEDGKPVLLEIQGLGSSRRGRGTRRFLARGSGRGRLGG